MLIGSAIAIKPYDSFMSEMTDGPRIAIWSILVGFFLAFFVLTSLGGTSLTSVIAKNYGFGGMLGAEVVLNSEGKETIKLLGFQCKQETKNELCILEKVDILWARGDEYVFQFSKKNDSDNGQDISKTWFTIPRRLVLSIKIPLSRHNGI